MKKKDFTMAIKKFRLESTGAACFYDPVRDKKFCANNLTEQQARDFARQHDLQLNNWFAGQTCSSDLC